MCGAEGHYLPTMQRTEGVKTSVSDTVKIDSEVKQ